MLENHNDKKCFLYPPLSHLAYDWQEVKDRLETSNPERYLNQDDIRWLHSAGRYPLAMPPLEILDGPFGGGLIYINEFEAAQPTLMFPLLASRLDYDTPLGMPQRRQSNCPCLTLLSDQRPFRTSKLKTIYLSPEHAESVDDRIYWLFDTKEHWVFEEATPRLSEDFGVKIYAIDFPEIDPIELGSITHKFKYGPRWYEVMGGPAEASNQLGILGYAAIYFRQSNVRLHSANLISQIAGAPNYRRHWFKSM